MPEEIEARKTIAVIGEPDVVSGFRALGFEVGAVRTVAEALSLARDLTRKGVAVCLMQDGFYQAVAATQPGKEVGTLPVFIPFGRDGSTAALSEMVKAIRLRATGTLS